MNQQGIEKEIINIIYNWLHDRDEYTRDMNPIPSKELLTLITKIRIKDLEEVRKLQKELQEWKIGKFCSTHQSHNIVAYLDSKIKSLKK